MSAAPTAATLLSALTAATGPRTPEGKARSSQNARKHGLLISDARLKVESAQEYAETYAGLLAAYSPLNAIEEHLVDALTLTLLRRRRLERAEAGLLNAALPEPGELTREQASTALAEAYESRPAQLDRLQRYRTAADRLYVRLLEQLRREASRQPRTRPLISEVAIERDCQHLPALTPPAPEPALPAAAEPDTEDPCGPIRRPRKAARQPGTSTAEAEPSLRARAPRSQPGRNQPCPCHSGLKYKRCCLGKA